MTTKISRAESDHPSRLSDLILCRPRGRMKRAGLCVAVIILAVVACSASSAFAAEPWWHVNTVSAPAGPAGQENMLVLEVSDLGDAAVNGAVDPVGIVDELPVGVTPTHVYGEGGGSFGIGIGIGPLSGVKTLIHCGIAGRDVSCSYAGPLLAYERFMIAIVVEVAPGAGAGVSTVRVSGGGAPPVVWGRALGLEALGGFGAENYELTPEEEGGSVDAQAGSHPFQLTTTLSFDSKTATVAGSLASALPGAPVTSVVPEVQPVGLTKDLRFDLPPGLVGNPEPLPKCPLSVFLKPSNTVRCPNDTVIGVSTPIITHPGSLIVPEAATVPLYSLEPSVGEPARFGFTTPLGAVILDTSVRTGGDYGVVVTVPDIPDDVGFVGVQTTFWGVPDDSRHDTTRGECLDEHEGSNIEDLTKLESACSVQEKPQPFLIMPTSCSGPLSTTVEGDSWEDIGQYSAPKQYTFANNAGEPFAEDGCNRLSFEPSIRVAADGQAASTPTGVSVDVHVDQEASLNPTGLSESEVRNTTVALPAGVALNPAGADGLSACPLLHGTEPGKEAAEEKDEVTGINLETRQPADCPESSKVATLKIKTPLLPNELEGDAYLATQNENPFGSLVALYLVAYDKVSGVRIKLAGEVQPCEQVGQVLSGVYCEAPGQLVSTFKETPQLPFEDLTLNFFGGNRAPLGSPALCGSYTTTASIAPWSGNPAAQASSEFEIDSGPNDTPCPNPPGDQSLSTLPFAPLLAAGSSNLQAGAFTPFTMTMSREDGNQNLKAIELKMPPGLSGTLSGVALCGEPQADEGTCGSASLIGETIVSVGLGGDPYTVTGGKVYITGPYNGQGPCTVGEQGCAPFGLSIVNPANAGPFHLGNVIVRAKIEVNPITAALTITSNNSGPYAIPQYIDGIPLQIKHVNVTINRPGFTFNPTNCSATKITGGLSSTEGSTQQLAVPFQVTNCATLKFQPKFAVTTKGKTSKADGASLAVKLTYPNVPQGTDANISKVKVDLPKQLPSRLTTLQKACTNAQFEANPAGCPAASVVGQAKAVTPLIPVPLEGPAYFVSHGGEAFPSLIVVLQGYGVKLDLIGTTFISKAGITSSTFKTVPDAPVGSFELTLPQGPYSALAANGNLCAPTKTVTTKKTVKEKVHGKTKKVTRKTTKQVAESLAMPTAFVGQNGAEIHESTPISVTGCAKARPAKKQANGKTKAAKKGKKK